MSSRLRNTNFGHKKFLYIHVSRESWQHYRNFFSFFLKKMDDIRMVVGLGKFPSYEFIMNSTQSTNEFGVIN